MTPTDGLSNDTIREFRMLAESMRKKRNFNGEEKKEDWQASAR